MKTKPMTVLIVDDSSTNVMLCKSYLEEMGFEICIAYNAKSALVTSQNCHPDLIIVDIMMPEMDGFQLITELKKMLSPLPQIMILSAEDDYKSKHKAVELGITTFISKPYNGNDLEKGINNIFSVM